MENFEEKIKGFLSVDHGGGFGTSTSIDYGSGYGFLDDSGCGYCGPGSSEGYGDGDGYGCGYGYSSGRGGGAGDGDGYGSGGGYGGGIKEYDGKPVYIIDDVPTILTNVHGDIAEGYVVREDLTLAPCFVARSGDFFSHGVTEREALLDARAKYEYNLSEEDRIKLFMEKYPSLGSIAACSDLFRWHHTLTGSCTMGRREFVAAHGIDVEKDSMTVGNFIALTRGSFGGDVIKRLEEEYKARQSPGSNPTPEEG